MTPTLQAPSAEHIARDIQAALAEDIGTGDLTALLIPPDQRALARVLSREQAIVSGAPWFDACLYHLDPTARITWHVSEGQAIMAQQNLCTIEANTRALLTAERTALNFLQTLCATATLTRHYVDAIADTSTRIVDTRKTLPGLRSAQKYAVRCGGGDNHRMGLYDGILIKENHIIAAGSISAALAAAREIAPPGVFIQIEVETLDQLDEALHAQAQMILLDNMDLHDLRNAVHLSRGRATLEASGGIRADNVLAIAQTGVQRISIGDLTKNIQAIDLSLRHIS
jgi:nicotinate-nucleotide pyrophosphorylase (carboxylating)